MKKTALLAVCGCFSCSVSTAEPKWPPQPSSEPYMVYVSDMVPLPAPPTQRAVVTDKAIVPAAVKAGHTGQGKPPSVAEALFGSIRPFEPQKSSDESEHKSKGSIKYHGGIENNVSLPFFKGLGVGLSTTADKSSLTFSNPAMHVRLQSDGQSVGAAYDVLVPVYGVPTTASYSLEIERDSIHQKLSYGIGTPDLNLQYSLYQDYERAGKRKR